MDHHLELSWNVLSADDILKHSVCNVFKPGMKKIDDVEYCFNTLADRRMGKVHSHDTCLTCKSKKCIGYHYGHIDLPVPIFYLHYIPTIKKILKNLCKICWNDPKFTTGHKCRKPKRIVYNKDPVFIIDDDKYYAFDVLNIFQNLPADIWNLPYDPTSLIATRIQVLPITARQYRYSTTGTMVQHPWTHAYDDVLKHIEKYKSDDLKHIRLNVYTDLHFAVNVLQSSKCKPENNSVNKKAQTVGILESLPSKQGKVRVEWLGKTCNNCARTVIQGDPNLPIDTIGVPINIANNIFIKVRVTSFNIDQVRWLIRHKKVSIVYLRSGTYETYINPFIETLAQKLRIGDQVERCLMNGDWIAYNRQPTLHAAGFMGFKVEIFPGDTFRMNTATVNAFNADFDGDEMNLHVPTTIEASADIENIMTVTNYVVGSSGSTQIGLIQNSLCGIYMLSKPGQLISKSDAMNMCFYCNSELNEQPSVFFKGKEYYTTTQVVASLLNEYKPFLGKEKTIILDNQGNYLKGIINKSLVGISGTLIRNIWVKNKQQSIEFINRLQKLASYWVSMKGLTAGLYELMPSKKLALPDITLDDVTVDNIFITKEEEEEKKEKEEKLKKRKKRTIDEINNNTTEIEFSDIINDVMFDINKNAYKNATLQGYNGMIDMLNSGSKGDMSKATQINTIIGLQSMSNGNIPQYLGDRPYAICKRGKFIENIGFVKDNYLTGISPLSVCVTQTTGREAMVYKIMKTAVTGELSREMVHRFIDYAVYYDYSVRNPSNDIIQIKYGDDGLDPVYKGNKMIEPGTPVGVIASHSLCEKATQATLNTFHQPGSKKNITSSQSTPRFLDILHVSDSINTRSVSMTIKDAPDIAVVLQNKEDWIKSYDAVYQLPTDVPWINDFQKAFCPLIGERWLHVVIDRKANGIGIGESLYELLLLFPIGHACISNPVYGEQDVEMYILITETVHEILQVFKKGKYKYIEAIEENKLLVSDDISNVMKNFPNALHLETMTNNIKDAYNRFGIEFAATVLLNEFLNLDIYKNNTDVRHFKLLVDIMCYSGCPKGIGIAGVASGTDSSLTVMCARDPLKSIISAAVNAEYDHNNTTFSRLLTGQEIPVGSTFDHLQVISKCLPPPPLPPSSPPPSMLFEMLEDPISILNQFSEKTEQVYSPKFIPSSPL